MFATLFESGTELLTFSSPLRHVATYLLYIATWKLFAKHPSWFSCYPLLSLSDALSLNILPAVLSALQQNTENYMYIQKDRHKLYSINNESTLLDAAADILGCILEVDQY